MAGYITWVRLPLRCQAKQSEARTTRLVLYGQSDNVGRLSLVLSDDVQKISG